MMPGTNTDSKPADTTTDSGAEKLVKTIERIPERIGLTEKEKKGTLPFFKELRLTYGLTRKSSGLVAVGRLSLLSIRPTATSR